MYTDALGAIMHTPLTPALWLRLHKQPKLTGHFASTHQTKVTPPLPIQQQPPSQIPSTPQTIIPFGLWEAPQSLLSPFHSIYNITQIGMPQKL